MKLEEQVLSIEQVQELLKLGFDIEKHSSMCWVAYTSDEEPYEKEYSLSILDEFCYESASLEPIPTMTIGDIIDILPIEIDEYVLDMNRKYVSYDSNDSKQNSLYYGYRHRFIDSLFNCLVWCIKEKHIEL
jgi:phosphoenolpyruvate synthase/pyruvate phosphate dikinase